MRITFLVNYDPAAALALHYLAPKLASDELSIFHTQKPARAATSNALVALSSFEQSQLDQHNVLQDLSSQLLNDINGEDFARYKETRPELVISIRHMSILQPAAIGVPERGVINLHSGLLPSYQGVMATFWAMKNQAAQLGTSLHFIDDASIDTGALIAQSTTPTQFNQSYYWNVLSLYRAGCATILNMIEKLRTGKQLDAKPQTGDANYYSFPSKTDIAEAPFPLFNTTDKLSAFF